MGGYVVAHLKRDIVQLGEKLRRILFSKCICFYWFLVFLKFWIFSILNTYFSTTISVISDLVLLSFELRILNFGFFKSHCQPLNFGFFLWSWALKTRLEGSVFFAGGVLFAKLTFSCCAFFLSFLAPAPFLWEHKDPLNSIQWIFLQYLKTIIQLRWLLANNFKADRSLEP